MPSNPPILECCGHDTYHEFIISFINHTLFSCQFDEGLVAYRLAHGTLDDDTVQIVLGSTRDYISNLCTWSITLPIFASSDLLPRLFGQLILSAPQHSSVMELVESLKIVNVAQNSLCLVFGSFSQTQGRGKECSEICVE
ncbi:hypothetical protein BLNAU_4108 [Blattamonas nauphoetae]|uniref:Uncharacterized protein n=1 Tax=Blattamonas nauphoetae TaxID=2049346 RepID=A0ABQ9YB75_9EUKA|nr:hypothetical protein BLNAU_4108 [Blattamonas nauphoetae]